MHEPFKPRSRILQFSNTEIASGVGIVLFLLSLAIPAIEHGKEYLGIECFIMGLLGVFSSSGQLLLMSLVAHLMHVSAMITLIIVWNRWNVELPWKTGLLLCTSFCIAILLTIPYSNIERVYTGYYIWLLSIAIIALSPFTPTTREGAG